MLYFIWGPKASGKKSRILRGVLRLVAESLVLSRILFGVLRLVAESVVFYVGS